MEPFETPEPLRRRFDPGADPLRISSSHHRGPARVRTPRVYRVCDGITEGLIYLMVIFTPWAFGTTQPWSIWTMNVAAYALGALLVTKWIIRWRTGYRPSRWGDDHDSETKSLSQEPAPFRVSAFLTPALAVLTCTILAYILVSALNARAVYLPGLRRFEYFDSISWLPRSYDSSSTWATFWTYTGLAAFFWSLRDWLLGTTASERHRRRDGAFLAAGEGMSAIEELSRAHSEAGGRESAHLPAVPDRLRRLLWVMCINGGILAVESILQRLSGTNKLLWLVQPLRNSTAEAQFGPYAYRSNAAQYFNLVWPVCLGFWMILRQAARRNRRVGRRIGEDSHVVLLPAAVLMAACPVISTSRGGALVAMLNMLVVMGILLWSMRKESFGSRAGVLALFIAIASFSGYLGWEKLAARLRTLFEDQMSRRPEIYDNALPIAKDYPMFGTGPGTFGSIYQLYRSRPDQGWAAYVHDDWLETRITFGWVGFTMILAALVLALARAFVRGGWPVPLEFSLLLFLAMAGCLMHAKYDFPFQIFSVTFAFLLVLGIHGCTALQRSRGR